MSVCEIDPLTDSRWPELLNQHALAAVFHSRNWLRSLKLTYGYEPVVYTTDVPRAQLNNGWVFCRVRSWLTGPRLVSLPFSDHCDPLVEGSNNLQEISRALINEQTTNHWRYIECRFAGNRVVPVNFGKSEAFHFHELDLDPPLEQLFRGLHKNSTQRKIRRAEREGLTYQEGSSEQLVDAFYSLHLRTRRRHRVPPQPRKWFSNLLTCFGSQLKVRVAGKNGMPVASIVTLSFKDTVVYKYGAADERCFPLGAMQSLLWRAIAEAKTAGFRRLDLGRSDFATPGLSAFKDRLGAQRSTVNYFRRPSSAGKPASAVVRRGQELSSYIPSSLLATAGRLLYRHFG